MEVVKMIASTLLDIARHLLGHPKKKRLRLPDNVCKVKRATFLPPATQASSEQEYRDSYDGLPDPEWLGNSEAWKRS